jgi:predicted HAD superfamily Cof-like phosphohydrolase
MDLNQKKVYVFHDRFRLATPEEPTFETLENYPAMRLIDEEVQELRDAIEARDMVEVIDALVDLEYFIKGTAVALGVDLEPFFAEVHRNNMTKLNADGEPEYDPDHKVKKPANYVPVDLKVLFNKMYPNYGKAQDNGSSDPQED